MNAKSGAVSLDELLDDINVPLVEVPEFGAQSFQDKSKDLFKEKRRKAWKELDVVEPRCDFAPNRIKISFRNPKFGIISLWSRSVYGLTLTEIKENPDMVERFAVGMHGLISQMLGSALSGGDWCIITAPKRRHKLRNFATLISFRLSELLGIPFYDDAVLCLSRHRVGAVFSFSAGAPKENNIIIFDDIVTTGSTMTSLHVLFTQYNKNCIFFTGINNKK